MLIGGERLLKLIEDGMISPYYETKQRHILLSEPSPFGNDLNAYSVPSYGFGGAGYDIRLSAENLYAARPGGFVDPLAAKKEDHITIGYQLEEGDQPPIVEEDFVNFTGDFRRPTIYDPRPHLWLAPGTCLLGQSMERFDMPRDVSAVATGKSGYARCFVNVLITPLEAGWEGILTIELVNLSPNYVKIYLNAGIAQLIFFDLGGEVAGYEGAYQHQQQTTFAGGAV